MVKVRIAEHDWLKGKPLPHRRYRTLQILESANGTVNIAIFGVKNAVHSAISVDRAPLLEAFTALFPNAVRK